MVFRGLLKSAALVSAIVAFGPGQFGLAQDNSGNTAAWTYSGQQQDPNGVANPTRTRETHTEVAGRVIDRTSVETLGPDGRYVPYSDTEKESVRVNSTTVRNLERTFGRGPDGQRTLIQEKQEESRSLPDGAQKNVRTTLNPDANGALQVVRREIEDSKQPSPGVRETKTTVLTPDVNGGLSPAVQIEEREKQSGTGAVEFKKSTMLSDGAGHWLTSEVREGTSTPDGGRGRTKEERVLRPDSNGALTLVERTVTKDAAAGPGDKRDTVETYSTNVPGIAGGDGNLHLVQRETSVRRSTSSGGQVTTRQVERPNPGAPSDGLHVTDEAIDIVRPGASGVAEHKSTILSTDSNGRLGEVWVDLGKTDNPSAIHVDTRTPAKSQ
jgi:hypothetical protein